MLTFLVLLLMLLLPPYPLVSSPSPASPFPTCPHACTTCFMPHTCTHTHLPSHTLPPVHTCPGDVNITVNHSGVGSKTNKSIWTHGVGNHLCSCQNSCPLYLSSSEQRIR